MSRQPKTAGGALVEIITALFIITFGVFSVLTMYNVGMDKTRALKEHGQVMNALQNELEGIRAMPFDSLPKEWNKEFVATEPDMPELVGVRPHLRIKPAQPGREDLLEVAASIRWKGEHGRLIEKSLVTLVAEKPLVER